MTYAQAMQKIAEGHAIVRKSWRLPHVCIVSFASRSMTWLDGHKVLPWSPSDECKTAIDWILADDVRKHDKQTRKSAVAAFTAKEEGGAVSTGNKYDAAKHFTWLRCKVCGWEHVAAAMVNQCGDCGTDDSLHIISNRDGELPKRLPRHANRCSNQNVLWPGGAYADVEECGCTKWQPT